MVDGDRVLVIENGSDGSGNGQGLGEGLFVE